MASLEQHTPVDQPLQNMELPPVFKVFEGITSPEHPGAENIFRNLEQMEAEEKPRSSANMEQIFRNLEQMELEEGGRCAREELSPDGVLRETITRLEADGGQPEGGEALEKLKDLEAAKDLWHRQERNNTCAIACSGFIINEFEGTDVSEGELREFVESQGWMRPGGISMEHAGKLLEAYGVENRITQWASYEELREALAGRDRVIVGVNNVAICTEWCDQYPAFSANHAIEVLDIDESDPKDVKVIVNDPGVENGRGRAVGLENFLDAWHTSGNEMLTAFRG